ncbi:MAG: hypothetical protein II376_06240 [Clostridia bacterium]|nr:hypothetical protein [Clostridia bacterium]
MTERLARSITALLDDCSPDDITVECHDLLREQAAGIKVDEETVVVIGMPVYVGKIPLPAAEALRKISGNGAMTIASVSYGGRSYGNALFELKSLAEDCGFRPIGAGAFLISCMARRGGSHGFATALDGEAMTEFSKAAAAKIRRLAGCEIEELKIKPAPLEVSGKMPVHKISRISPRAAAAAQKVIERVSLLKRHSEWFL